jgi:hypothetical protein
MFSLLAAFVLLPIVASALYVAAWPGVAVRPVVTAAIGAVIGIVGAAVCIYWAALPLTKLGIASGSSGGDSLWQLLGARLLVAAALTVGITVFAVWATSRAFAPRP